MICKNVINGYMKQYGIEEVTIIDGHQVLYSGLFENFWKGCDPEMIVYRNQILKRECQDKTVLGNRKLFLFIKEEQA